MVISFTLSLEDSHDKYITILYFTIVVFLSIVVVLSFNFDLEYNLITCLDPNGGIKREEREEKEENSDNFILRLDPIKNFMLNNTFYN